MAYRKTEKVLKHEEETRKAILRAASSLVRAGRPLTMDAVADGAGVSVGSLYTYFHNRGDLMVALFDFRAAKELQVMEEVLAGADPRAALAEAARLTFRRGSKNPGMTLFLLLERMDRDERLESAKLLYHRRHCAALAACIQRGIRGGSFVAQNPEVTAAAMLGAIIETVTRGLAGDDILGRMDPPVLEEELVSTVLRLAGTIEV